MGSFPKSALIGAANRLLPLCETPIFSHVQSRMLFVLELDGVKDVAVLFVAADARHLSLRGLLLHSLLHCFRQGAQLRGG